MGGTRGAAKTRGAQNQRPSSAPQQYPRWLKGKKQSSKRNEQSEENEYDKRKDDAAWAKLEAVAKRTREEDRARKGENMKLGNSLRSLRDARVKEAARLVVVRGTLSVDFENRQEEWGAGRTGLVSPPPDPNRQKEQRIF